MKKELKDIGKGLLGFLYILLRLFSSFIPPSIIFGNIPLVPFIIAVILYISPGSDSVKVVISILHLILCIVSIFMSHNYIEMIFAIIIFVLWVIFIFIPTLKTVKSKEKHNNP